MPSALDTKFAAMPIGPRKRWLDWAASHDWGSQRAPHYIADTGAICCYSSEHDGTEWHEVSFDATTPRQMRDWAGY